MAPLTLRHFCFALDAFEIVKMDVVVNHLVGFHDGSWFVAVDALCFENKVTVEKISISVQLLSHLLPPPAALDLRQ